MNKKFFSLLMFSTVRQKWYFLKLVTERYQHILILGHHIGNTFDIASKSDAHGTL